MKTTAETVVSKVPQPHGGALNSGGTPGNRGGTGRPRSELRADLRALLDGPGREVLHRVLQSENVLVALRALDLVAKYGLGSRDEDERSLRVTELARLMSAMGQAIDTLVPDPLTKARIGQAWKILSDEYF